MDDLRHPIGPFRSLGRSLTDSERSTLIDKIAEHPTNMRAAVAGLSDQQLDTRYREGGWTVRQVVHHVADSHMNSYVRFKLATTDDDATVGTYDEVAWAELPDAKQGPVEGSLRILDALHARWVAFLRGLSAEQWTRTIRYPEVGEVTVDVLLEIYGWHCPHHEAHITELRKREGW